MPDAKTAPYGSWKSPITSDLIVSETVGLSQPRIDGDDIYWIEMRPSERGRQVIVRQTSDGKRVDINPPDFNTRTRVHEYGGGDYVVHNGAVYFSNFTDQQIYRQNGDTKPERVTTECADDRVRYADAIVDAARDRLIAVREDHRQSDQQADNSIVAISIKDGTTTVIASGNDFYSSLRLSPDGSRLAWLTWNHPNMPWDGCELWCGEIAADGSVVNSKLIAGGLRESIFQPEWSPEGVLYFVSDRTGWWNLYRANEESAECLVEMEAEFGAPQWVFGLSTYAFESADRIVCSFVQKGIWSLGTIETRAKTFRRIETPYTEISFVRASHNRALFRAGSPRESLAIVQLDLNTGKTTRLQQASKIEIDPGYISEPTPIEFPTENGLTAHGFYYPPKNRDFVGPAGELPLLLVKSHGGPTSATIAVLMLTLQYWTSRGVAILDVNYGGSTGYGRGYRERLNGTWGIADVDDCVNGAKFLEQRGDVDANRSMIDGGSAGGYTTLCALTFRDYFKAGASYFGVSDLEALELDTHKFESKYSDGLVGPYPDRRDLYIERSPIHFTDQLSCPVIFFQGLEDKVVPPNQAEMMVEALRKKGLPVAYVPFEGEQHGFRRAENIKRSLDGEMYFYSRVFGFELADEIEPVKIENLK
ncbi:MAG TPA: prolyl oligopeptidase family serine peptidase [Pyrinomonadaceae bacterium]|nr:prolyl oligopeptidase family serine peptidase [Pyrinomonadaceae bacterium]